MTKNLKRSHSSIRRTILIIFITIISLSTLGMGFIVFSNWSTASEDMMYEMSIRLNSEIESKIADFIDVPTHINEVQHFIVQDEIIDLNDAVERERYFVGVMTVHGSAVYSFSYGTETGEYYGVRRNALGELEIMRNNADTGYHTWYYSVNADMSTGHYLSQTASVFDARTRDWYNAAKDLGYATFSPIYKHFVMDDLTVSAAYPIYDQNNVLLGVLGAHVILSGFEAILKDAVLSTDGIAVIVEKETGLLISNTTDFTDFDILENNTVQRYSVYDMENETFINAYDNYLSTGIEQDRYKDKDNDYFIQTREISENGIDWLVISAIPESYLATGITFNIWVSLLVFFIAIVIAAYIYLRYINKAFLPLSDLIYAAESYSLGNFSVRIPFSKQDEIGVISVAFNSMATKTEFLVNNLEKLVMERTENLEKSRNELLLALSDLKTESKSRIMSEQRLNLFFTQSLTGFFFMMLDEPVEWNDQIDKEKTLDYIFDHQHITKANSAFVQQYGLTEAELMAQTPNQSFAHDLEQGRAMWRRMLDEGVLHVDTSEKNADGSDMIIEGDYIVIYDDDGKVLGHFGNQQDVTLQRNTQNLLKDSEEKYRLLYSSMSQGLALHEIVTDDNGKPIDYIFLDINDSYTKLLGVKKEDSIGKRITEVMPDVEPYWIEVFGKVALTGEPMYYENYLATTGRYYKTYSYSPKPRFFAVLVTDITERKNAEQALVHSHELLNYIIDHSNGGVAVHDKNMNYIYVSQLYLEEYGIKDQNVIGKNHYEIFPDLPQKWRDIHKLALNGIVSHADDDPYYHLDGSIDWTRWECRPWYESDQSIGGIIVYTEIINERKRLELELLKEKETLLATLHSIGDGVISTDAFGRISSMNEVAERFTGWTEKEAQSEMFETVFTIISEETGLTCENPVDKVFSTKGVVELANHTILIAKDKTRLFIEDCASPIKNSSNEIIGVVLVFRDVTEKKQKQREIEFLSYHDYLTNLNNRRSYVESFDKLNQDKFLPLGIMMFDVNGLKIINDAYGHDIGDQALKTVASVLSQTFAAEDVVARIGGDEFAVILPKTSLEKMQGYKDALRKSMSEKPIMNVVLSIATGYEIMTESGKTLDEMLKMAENHMYRHKLAEGVSVRNGAIQAILSTLTDKFEPERNHSEVVSLYCKQIGEALELRPDDIKELTMAGMFHDIGKISIPDSILEKPGKLTDLEFETIKTHTEIGYQILRAADQYSDLAIHALCHHERWDGKGYPQGLKANDIPLFSRIISVADSFQAMTAERPYKKSLTIEDAIIELKRCSGSQFDPEIVTVFIENVLMKSE